MRGLTNLANWFGTALMTACFVLAFVSAAVTALATAVDGDLLIAGVGLGATGVWVALGFFFYAESNRQAFEECLEDRLDDMFERLGKCECRCQTDAIAE